MSEEAAIRAAARALRSAEAIVIGAGAGMSVDAGIPAYRLSAPSESGGTPRPAQGLLGALTPMLFRTAPELAWGRAGVQLSLFRETRPHRGYEILLAWSRRTAAGAFVITSNVDGMFAKVGFPERNVLEGHGSLHFMQCTRPCTQTAWSAAEYTPRLDAAGQFAIPPLPKCPSCGDNARPNVFMFGDHSFTGERVERQLEALDAFLGTTRGMRFVVVECGAGTAIPTIRLKCEALARDLGAPLVRINPLESQADDGVVRVPLGALDALERIDAAARAL